MTCRGLWARARDTIGPSHGVAALVLSLAGLLAPVAGALGEDGEPPVDVLDMVRDGIRFEVPGARALLHGKRLREVTLQSLREQALSNNLDVLAGQLSHASAMASVSEKTAAFDPIYNLSWFYTRTETFQRDAYIARFRAEKADADEEEIIGCIIVDGQVIDPESNPNCFTAPVYNTALELATTPTAPLAIPHSWTGTTGLTQPFSWGGVVSGSLSSTYRKKNTYTVGLLDSYITESDPFGFKSRMPWTSSASVSFSTPVPFTRYFGQHGSQANLDITQARSSEKIRRAQRMSTRNSVLETVTKAYWDLVESVEDLKTLTAHRRILDEMYERTRRLYEGHRTTAYDMDQVEAELGNLLNREEIAWNTYLARSNAILSLIDNDLDEVLVPVAAGGLSGRGPEIDQDKAYEVALENNPDIGIGLEDLAASRAARKFRENQVLPNLSLSLSYTLSQVDNSYGYETWEDSISHVFSPDKSELFVGFRYTVPLWKRAEMAALNSARVAEKQASDRVRQTRNSVVRRVGSALNDVMSSEALIDYTASDLRLATLAYEKARDLHQRGLVTKFDLLSKLDDLRTARQANISARITRRKAEAELLSAQGVLDLQYPLAPIGAEEEDLGR